MAEMCLKKRDQLPGEAARWVPVNPSDALLRKIAEGVGTLDPNATIMVRVQVLVEAYTLVPDASPVAVAYPDPAKPDSLTP